MDINIVKTILLENSKLDIKTITMNFNGLEEYEVHRAK